MFPSLYPVFRTENIFDENIFFVKSYQNEVIYTVICGRK
jgi:hypothetical protein